MINYFSSFMSLEPNLSNYEVAGIGAEKRFKSGNLWKKVY